MKKHQKMRRPEPPSWTPQTRSLRDFMQCAQWLCLWWTFRVEAKILGTHAKMTREDKCLWQHFGTWAPPCSNANLCSANIRTGQPPRDAAPCTRPATHAPAVYTSGGTRLPWSEPTQKLKSSCADFEGCLWRSSGSLKELPQVQTSTCAGDGEAARLAASDPLGWRTLPESASAATKSPTLKEESKLSRIKTNKKLQRTSTCCLFLCSWSWVNEVL